MTKNTMDRAEGAAKELGGKIKKTVGKAIGNEQMEAEGLVTELTGKGEQAAAKTKERVKGATEELVGKVKGGVGKLIDNEQMEAEGKAAELLGKARQAGNQ